MQLSRNEQKLNTGYEPSLFCTPTILTFALDAESANCPEQEIVEPETYTVPPPALSAVEIALLRALNVVTVVPLEEDELLLEEDELLEDELLLEDEEVESTWIL